jgi:hypothetical protein
LLGNSLGKKLRKAKAIAAEMTSAFEALDAVLDDSCREQWEDAEKRASKERGEYLRIYDVQLEKGQRFQKFPTSELTACQRHPWQRFASRYLPRRNRLGCLLDPHPG